MARINPIYERVRPNIIRFFLPVMSIAMLLLTVPRLGAYGHTTYDIVVKSVSCYQFMDALHCNYKVGRSLRDVGGKLSEIAFIKSDKNGDFYAAFGVPHGCVLVMPGKSNPRFRDITSDLAWVSPWTGKVYRHWLECKLDRKASAQ